MKTLIVIIKKEKKTTASSNRKKLYIVLKKLLVLTIINGFKRFNNKGNLSNKGLKSRQSLEKFVFVNKKFTMQHKEINNTINSTVTPRKIEEYILQ